MEKTFMEAVENFGRVVVPAIPAEDFEKVSLHIGVCMDVATLLVVEFSHTPRSACYVRQRGGVFFSLFGGNSGNVVQMESSFLTTWARWQCLFKKVRSSWNEDREPEERVLQRLSELSDRYRVKIAQSAQPKAQNFLMFMG